MVALIILNNICVISHFSRQPVPDYVYTFRKDFVAEHIWQHLCSFTTFNKAMFLLNDQQDGDFRCIIDKIKEEEHSDYIFSEDLQRTYLVEMIHFINKVQERNSLLSAG